MPTATLRSSLRVATVICHSGMEVGRGVHALTHMNSTSSSRLPYPLSPFLHYAIKQSSLWLCGALLFRAGHRSVASMLLAAGAYVNAKTMRAQETALHFACKVSRSALGLFNTML
jgi:hypothetical protein